MPFNNDCNSNNNSNNNNPTQKSALEDHIACHQALLFCAELDRISRSLGFRLSFVLDFGSVLGGFISTFHFDLLGQSLRWVLRMLEFRETEGILVSDNVRRLL